MSEWEKAMELEDTQLMAEKMDSVLLAVSEAVCKGDYTMDNYQWAFIVLQEMSGKLKGKLMEIANRAMAEYKSRDVGCTAGGQ